MNIGDLDDMSLEWEKFTHKAKHELVNRWVEQWLKSDEAKKAFESIQIDMEEIRERVTEKIVDEIIRKWKEEE